VMNFANEEGLRGRNILRCPARLPLSEPRHRSLSNWARHAPSNSIESDGSTSIVISSAADAPFYKNRHDSCGTENWLVGKAQVPTVEHTV